MTKISESVIESMLRAGEDYQTAHYSLLRRIFDEFHSAERLINEEVEAALKSETGTEAIYAKTVKTAVYGRLLSGEFAMSPLSEADIAHFDEMLNTLTPRQELALRLTFGLDGDSPKTAAEIGAEPRFNEGMPKDSVSPSRVGQVIAKALRKMRHTSRSRQLRPMIQVRSRALELSTKLAQVTDELENAKDELERTKLELNAPSLVLLRARAEAIELGVTKPQEVPPLHTDDRLDVSINEIEMSVRTWNCLDRADILTIREIVVRTEAEILRTRNFGKKSFAELKEIIYGMGLWFGMEFDADGKPIPKTEGKSSTP